VLYLFFLASLWLAQSSSRRLKLDVYPLFLTGVIGLGVYSLTLDQELTTLSLSGLFLPYWHYFLIGVLISHVLRGKPGANALLLGWIAIEIGFLALGTIKSYPVAGIVFGLFIFCLWRWKDLDSLLADPVFQYLGTISYTLYLVHPDIGWKAISLGQDFFDGEMSTIASLLVFIMAFLLSMLGAHVLHVVFEKPSLWLCQQL